ncbi:MAG: helix-turn-helix transcriptional regulator [Kurthia sp.]
MRTINKGDLLKFVGNKIKEIRKRNNLKQSDLAKKINVSNTSISEYERGNVNIDADTLFQIAAALNVKVDDFFPARNTESSPIDLMNQFRSINMDTKYLLMFKDMFEKASAMSGEERDKYLESLKLTIEFHDNLRNK